MNGKKWLAILFITVAATCGDDKKPLSLERRLPSSQLSYREAVGLAKGGNYYFAIGSIEKALKLCPDDHPWERYYQTVREIFKELEDGRYVSHLKSPVSPDELKKGRVVALLNEPEDDWDKLEYPYGRLVIPLEVAARMNHGITFLYVNIDDPAYASFVQSCRNFIRGSNIPLISGLDGTVWYLSEGVVKEYTPGVIHLSPWVIDEKIPTYLGNKGNGVHP